jgi:hypothetical protein
VIFPLFFPPKFLYAIPTSSVRAIIPTFVAMDNENEV